MRAIAVVGFKKSGKTTLALELAQALRAQGFSVTLAKHSHHGFDEKPDTDTGRFRAAADLVMAFSPGGGFLSWPEDRPLSELLGLVRTDFLVLEGGKTVGHLPRVIIAGDEATARELDPELALASYGDAVIPGLGATRDVAELARLAVDKGFLLPGLDCGACGRENCRALCADIVAGSAGVADCKALSGSLRVTVNGAQLAMNPFVERILQSGIRGLLQELKGYGPGPVEIRLD